MFPEYFLAYGISSQIMGIYVMVMMMCSAFAALVLLGIKHYLSGIQARKLNPASRALVLSTIGYACFVATGIGQGDLFEFIAIIGSVAFIASAFQVIASCLAIHTHAKLMYLYQHQIGILTTAGMLFCFSSFIYPLDFLRPNLTFILSLGLFALGAIYRLSYWQQSNFGDKMISIGFVYCTLSAAAPLLIPFKAESTLNQAIVFLSLLPTTLAWFSGTLVSLIGLHMERIEELSDWDRTTNLTSERRFYERVSDFIHLVNRNRAASTMAELQVDDLTNLKKRYGTSIEPLIMKSIGDVIQSSLRQTDIASRIDQSRIAIYMPFETREDALIAARRISERVDQLVLFHEKTPFTISVSIGMHQLELDEQVDSAIFQARQQLLGAQERGGHLIQMDADAISLVDHSISA